MTRGDGGGFDHGIGVEPADKVPRDLPAPSATANVASEHRPEPLVYVPGFPEWDTEIAVTGSVWREGEPYPWLVKPNNSVAEYIVRVVNDYEERLYADFD